MESTRYLVVGSSHAALEAIQAIRMHDAAGSLALLTRDTHLPYSPTVLPYVVSGRSAPGDIALRDETWFAEHKVDFRRGRTLKALHVERDVAEFDDGGEVGYEKLLLATGASPAIPPIAGIETVEYHVLRSLDDAVGLRAAIAGARAAVVLGAGLVGMHAAENLVKAGVPVTIVEMAKQLTDGYFDATAAALIEKAFTDNGATIMTGSRVVGLAPSTALGVPGATLTLDSGATLEADLLLVATGVRANIDFLGGSGARVAHDKGILVDDTMQTSADRVWAAGDCAQARSFFGGGQVMNSILPDAAEQGRIAGQAMAGDPGLRRYAGGVPLNTYHFFGRHAISVGSSRPPDGAEVVTRFDAASGRYLKAIFVEGRLFGIYGVGEFFDAGVMCQLILRGTDLTPVKERFVAEPMKVGRELMSKLWR